MNGLNGYRVGKRGDDPAAAAVSTSSTSASAYVVDEQEMPVPTNTQPPPEYTDSGEFGEGSGSE